MLSHTGHVMTLANSIIGASILAMPFCFQKCGIILAILLLIVSNWITRICCHYIIKSSLLTRRRSFEFLGFHAFGSSGKLFVELCIIGYLLGTCITYYVVVGDLGPQIITKMFSLDSDSGHLRIYFMFAVTLVCILPLAMLKNVDSLSAVCTASIGFYVCLVIKIILESEPHILANDWTTSVLYWRPAGILQCLPIFSMALSCQMQLFEVFKSVHNQSVEKLNGIVRDSTWICTCVYIAVGFFGYVAFCSQPFSGNILLNFSPSFGSDVIKIGFILSVAFSFPLVIFPCRASIYSLLYRKGHTDAAGGFIPETRFKMITTFIVGLTLCIALIIPSVELIIGLVGSTIGVAICIMFPAACFRKIIKKNTNDRSVALSSVILVSGFCLMVLGTYANLQAIDEHSSGAHLEAESIPIKLIKPSEMPAIKKELQRLFNDKLDAEAEDNKLLSPENPKLPQAEVKKENSFSGVQSQNMEEVNKMIAVSTAPRFELDDEIKIDEKIEKSILEAKKVQPEEQNKNPVIEMLKPVENQNLSIDVVDSIGTAKVLEPLPNPRILAAPAPPINIADIIAPSESSNVLQQTIDKDAIKKDEEIAAEERSGKKISKNADDELAKTQNELQKTKELLERKVDEIKEELAKQNIETQNLVAEKLGEVVEKVEKIEREVQKKDEKEKSMIAAPITSETKISQDLFVEKLAEVVKKVGEIEEKVQRKEQEIKENEEKLQSDGQKNKNLDLAVNEKKKNISDKIAAAISPKLPKNSLKQAKAQVYEPLSYKTGEIIENVRNATKLEHNLPLPLPLLINAPRNKPNDSKDKEDSPKIPNLDQQKLPLAPLNATNFIQPKPESLDHKESPISKEKVEAIRRDILELNTEKGVTTIKPPNDLTDSEKRFKRSADTNVPDLKAIDAKLTKENCLSEPNMDTIMQYGSSGALDFKKQGIGRDLKSLQNDKRQQS